VDLDVYLSVYVNLDVVVVLDADVVAVVCLYVHAHDSVSDYV